MSGHSKWSTIKRKKGVADARRGQLFTGLARDIALAAREGGGDPETNFKLRLAVDKARANNMPKENIERSIKRGTGEDKNAAAFESVTYEAYAPHGIALLIQVVTDNRNRTVAELRHALARSGGSLAEGGAVSWQFARKGYLTVRSTEPDKVFEMAVEAGADDVVTGDDEIEIFTPVEAFRAVTQRLEQAGFKPDEAELRMEPQQRNRLAPDETVQLMRLIESLEELEDVQAVYSNLEVTDEALVAMGIA